MKKNYKGIAMLLTVMMLASSISAQQPIYIGKSADVLASYKAKADERARNAKTTSNKISHKISAQIDLILNVNFNRKTGITEAFIGNIDKSKGSSFLLKVSGNEVSGYIVIPEKKKAYEYFSTADGQVYLKETDINKIICVDYEADPAIQSIEQSNTAAITVPVLQSLPGAEAVVLLDFDGQYVELTNWNGGSPINAAPASLTETEMVEVWKMISEDFRPFNLNITTSEAVFFNAPVNRRTRVIFTPTKEWYGSVGGVAYLGSFTWGLNFWGKETPCWAFHSTSKKAGEVGSHEVGHTLGLNHDGRTNPPEMYYHGQNNWGPIMGSCYTVAQSQWSKGEYVSANNREDDLQIISTRNGFTYRTDDHANTSAGATVITTDLAMNILPTAKGIITTTTDVDVFYFVTTGGPVNIKITPHPSYPNLDIVATLKRSTTTVATSNPATTSAGFSMNLSAGTYHLYIDGGRGSLGADSDYGSLGEYFISGSFYPKGLYVMNTSPQIVCSGSFFDPGFLGNYGNNLDIAQTFKPETPGNMLRFTFTSFDLLNSGDQLSIFNGSSINAPLIGTFTNTSSPGTVTASNDAGQLTFRFISNSSVTAPGWRASISCVTPLTMQWNKRFGGTGIENVTAAIKTTDGGYLVGGYSNSGLGGDKSEASRGLNDYWVVKLSATGTKQWDKRFGGSADDFLNSMVQTTDGGYMLAGSSASGISGDRSQPSWGNKDYWIVKISGAGAKLWDKRFGTSSADELANIIATKDGGYLLTGSTAGMGGDKMESSRGGMDYWIVKISSTGLEQWDRRFGSVLMDEAKAAVQIADGSYLIAGRSNGMASGDKSEANWGSNFTFDYWVVKININGTKLWDRRFGGSYTETLSSAVATNDGGYMLSGSSQSTISGDKSEPNRDQFGDATESGFTPDYWVIKLDGVGGKLWDKTLGGDKEDVGTSLTKLHDGGFLIGGFSKSGISGDRIEASRGWEDYWVVKLSSFGTKLWDKRFGGTSTDELRAVALATDGGFVLAGRSLSGAGGDKTEASRGNYDYWILKTLPPFGTLNQVVNDPGTNITSTMNDAIQPIQQAENIHFRAMPNPFIERLSLSFTVEKASFVSLDIYDVEGRLVQNIFQQNAEAGKPYQFEFHATNLRSGIYFARLMSEDKIKQIKLVIIR